MVNPCTLENYSNFLSKLMYYVIILGIKFQCTNKINIFFFFAVLFSLTCCTCSDYNFHFNYEIKIIWKVTKCTGKNGYCL